MLAEYVSISCTQTEHIIVAITVKDPQDRLEQYVSISCTQTGHILFAITCDGKDCLNELAEYVSINWAQTVHIVSTNTGKYSQENSALCGRTCF